TASSLTAATLGLFTFGIFAAALIPLIFRGFFSLKDTKTPTLIAIVSMILNIILSFYLVNILSFPGESWLGNWLHNTFTQVFSLQGINDISILGLPLAVSISTIFQFLISVFVLNRKIVTAK
ncbi:MAG: hypothetical protein KJI71_01905, partial [Patescibacteria group bacterium]|nr:hypothetical protein [Patescibacteria group bacterium]